MKDFVVETAAAAVVVNNIRISGPYKAKSIHSILTTHRYGHWHFHKLRKYIH
jgi:hypothetical protein